MFTLKLFLITALNLHASPLRAECDGLLASLEAARGQRVPSMMLRSQLDAFYRADPLEFLRRLAIAQAEDPRASLEMILRSTLEELRRAARQR